jgi:hypothetical protein
MNTFAEALATRTSFELPQTRHRSQRRFEWGRSSRQSASA